MNVPLQRASGVATISFKQRGGDTVLDGLYQDGSAKVRMARAEPGRLCEAVLINTSGGMTDGDRYEANLSWGGNTTAIVTTQAAERYYKSRGASAHTISTLNVASGASAFWLPQESIIFDGAAFRRNTSVNLCKNSRFLGIETSIYGRTAMGETLYDGSIHETWKIQIDGKPAFIDAFALEGNINELLQRPSIANGALAQSTIICYARELTGIRDQLNSLFEAEKISGAATSLDQLLIIRLISGDAQALRKSSMQVLEKLMASMIDADSMQSLLPRVWLL